MTGMNLVHQIYRWGHSLKKTFSDHQNQLNFQNKHQKALKGEFARMTFAWFVDLWLVIRILRLHFNSNRYKSKQTNSLKPSDKHWMDSLTSKHEKNEKNLVTSWYLTSNLNNSFEVDWFLWEHLTSARAHPRNDVSEG